MTPDPDLHVFLVDYVLGVMSIRCIKCSWLYTYRLGSEDEFQKAKTAAAEHRKGPVAESEIERYRR